jgi:hypothetical protein
MDGETIRGTPLLALILIMLRSLVDVTIAAPWTQKTPIVALT